MASIKEAFRQEVIESISTTYPQWQVKTHGEFAISVDVEGRNGLINLDNLYCRVQLCQESKEVLIQHFLSEFVRVITAAENSCGSFEAIKDRISLVVRPVDLYSESLQSNEQQLAYSLQVLPDLALYWVVDNANSWQYISKTQFSEWKVSPEDVMRLAYENTCKAERCMHTEDIGEVGLLISSNRRLGTISHLLCNPRNLSNMIQSKHPDWPEQPYSVCIPIPHLIVVTKKGHERVIRDISLIAQEHYGKALSNRIYIFSKGSFTGEVICHNHQNKSTIIN